VFDQIVRNGTPESARLTRSLLPPQTWHDVGTRAIQSFIEEAIEHGRINGDKLLKLGDKHRDVLKEVFPSGDFVHTRQFAEGLKRGQERGSEIGKVGIQLTQFGALSGVLSGKLSRAFIGVTGIPYVLARIMTTPGGVKWQTEGLDPAPKTAAFIRTGNQILAQAFRTQLQSEAYDGPPPKPMPSHAPTQLAAPPPRPSSR
jgi:hypothetical protein